MAKRIRCPKCRESVTVDANQGGVVVCPGCHSRIKIKQTPSQQALSSPDVSEDATPSDPAPVGESYGISDTYGFAPTQQPPAERDETFSLEEPQAAEVASESSRAAETGEPTKKKRKKAASDAEPVASKLIALLPLQRKTWVILGGAAAAVVLVGGLLVFMAGPKEIADRIADPGAAVQEIVAGIAGEDTVVVIDAPAPAKPVRGQDLFPSNLGLAPSNEAKAIAGDGTPEAPGEWTALPVLTPDPEFQRRPTSDIPIAYNQDHYVMLFSADGLRLPSRTPHVQEKAYDSTTRRDYYWRKLAWETGEPAESLHWFGFKTGVRKDNRDPVRQPSPIVAALSPDGKLFAAEDTEQPGRVRVWRADGSVADFPFTQEEQAVRWLDWSKSGNLLTLSAKGVLAAWSIEQKEPEWKPLWTVQGDESSFVTNASGRAWLALATTADVFLLDPQSGQRLGRLAFESEYPIRDVAISPNGQRLATVHIPDQAQARKNMRDFESSLVIWDLKQGSARTAKFKRNPNPVDPRLLIEREQLAFKGLKWVADDRLLIFSLNTPASAFYGNGGGERNCLYDVTTSGLRAAVQPKVNGNNRSDGRFYFNARGDAWRQFWNGKLYTYFPVTYLSREDKTHQPLFEPIVSKPPAAQDNVQIVVDAGSKKQSHQRAEDIARHITDQGVQIGPGGLTLKVKFFVVDRNKERPKELSDQETVHLASEDGTIGTLTGPWGDIDVPFVMGSWRLVDADGKELWRTASREFWVPHKSKYKEGRGKSKFVGAGRFEVEYNFNFDPDEPRQAIGEEILASTCHPEKVIYNIKDIVGARGQFQFDDVVNKTLERMEAKSLTADEQKQAVKVISEYLAREKDLPTRHRSALQSLIRDRQDDLSNRITFRDLKTRLKHPDLRPPVVPMARSSLEDFVGLQESPAEREPIAPWRLGLTEAWELPKHPQAPMTTLASFARPPAVFSPDGKTIRLATASALVAYDRQNQKLSECVPLGSSFIRDPVVAVSPTFEHVACRGSNRLLLIDAKNPENQITIHESRTSQAGFISFTADGRYLVYWTSDSKKIHFWEIAKKATAFEYPVDELWRSLTFSPDGSLAVIGQDEVLHFLDLRTFKPAGQLAPPKLGRQSRLAFSEDFSTLAWTGDGAVYICKMERDKTGMAQLRGQPETYYFPWILGLSLNNDGSQIAAVTGERKAITVWETKTGRVLRVFEPDPKEATVNRDLFEQLSKSSSQPIRVTFSPTGAELAAATWDDKLWLVDLKSTEPELLAANKTAARLDLEQTVLEATGGKPKVAALDAKPTGQFTLPKPRDGNSGPDSYIQAVDFDPEGKHFRIHTAYSVLVYDSQTQKLAYEIAYIPPKGEPANRPRWSKTSKMDPGGRFAAFNDVEGNVVLCSKDRKEPIHLKRKGDITGFAKQFILGFSPDGERLYTQLEFRKPKVAVWNTVKGRIEKEYSLTLPSTRNGAGVFSSDGKLFARQYGKEHIRIFDTEKFDMVAELSTGISPRQVSISDPQDLQFAQQQSIFAFAYERDCFLWSNDDGIAKLAADSKPTRVPETDRVHTMLVDPQRKLLVTAIKVKGTGRNANEASLLLRLRDWKTAALLAEFTSLPCDTGNSANKLRMAVSPDGLLVACYNTQVQLINLNQLLPK